jgi:hypothetical protein
MMTAMMRNGLEQGFILDRQWFWLRGEMERTKRPALLALAWVFAEAAADPACRRSKRLQDLVDAQALLESTPPLEQELSAEERALLDRLPR